MLVAHVEQQGVWLVEGGMHRLAAALAGLAAGAGGRVPLRGGGGRDRVDAAGVSAGVRLASGERIAADAVVVNADAAALAAGLFGRAVAARGAGGGGGRAVAVGADLGDGGRGGRFPLVRHNVFFSRDYAAEFDATRGAGGCRASPTVYVCAQDRGRPRRSRRTGPERLLILVNAPADGDTHAFTPTEIERCRSERAALLDALRAATRPTAAPVTTTPGGVRAAVPGDGGRAVRAGGARLDGDVPRGRASADGGAGAVSGGGQRRIRGRGCRWRRCRGGWRRRR